MHWVFLLVEKKIPQPIFLMCFTIAFMKNIKTTETTILLNCNIWVGDSLLKYTVPVCISWRKSAGYSSQGSSSLDVTHIAFCSTIDNEPICPKINLQCLTLNLAINSLLHLINLQQSKPEGQWVVCTGNNGKSAWLNTWKCMEIRHG